MHKFIFQLAIFSTLVAISGCCIKPIAKHKSLFEKIDAYLQAQVDTAKLSPTPGITIANGETEIEYAADTLIAGEKNKIIIKQENT